MHNYILDTKFATVELIKLISGGENELKRLTRQYLSSMKDDVQRHEIHSKSLTDIDRSLSYVGCQLDEIQVHDPLELAIKRAVYAIDVKRASVGALCGALLQIAKQGISVTYGNIRECPDGRLVGSEKLKNIIWQARNQTMHYEEGEYYKSVKKCFSTLENDHGSHFHLSDKNLAKEVIDLLGWMSYDQYEKDMISLLG